MAPVCITREGITLRYGDLDTPAPEGLVNASPPPRIVVAVSPIDARTKVGVVLRRGDLERSITLRPGRRTREEQFFEGSFPNLRDGDEFEHSVRVVSERRGAIIRI